MENEISVEVEEYVKTPIKIYIKINGNKEIIDINSSVFIQDFTDWIEVDEGFGDKYAHAQSQYLEKPLINYNGLYNYSFKRKKIIEN